MNHKRICIVSGAAGGIGRAVCKCFSLLGYECIGLDRDEQGLAGMIELSAKLCFDLMNLDHYQAIDIELKRLTQDAAEITLINNLGGSNAVNQYEQMWENVVSTFEFNLKCLVNLTEIVVRNMKDIGQGRIVNVSSISGRYNLETINEDYAAAKASIIGLSRILAGKLAKENILVNTVCPGIIGTERILNRWEERDPEYNKSILNQIPLKRLGTPAEVAKAIAFLGGSENTYMTGAVLDINGGMYMP